MEKINKIFTLLIPLTIFLAANTMVAQEKPGDEEIEDAVQNELLYNATTPAYLVDAMSREGVVTLEGSVNNILAKDQAVKIARSVRGVRAVIDKIEVDAPSVSDEVLENDVHDALFMDPATDSYEIDIDAKYGVVSLNGVVNSWQEKQLSEFVAKNVVGVKAVENNLTFRYTEDRLDFEIQRDIERTLKNDIRIDDGLVEVDVENGDVELSGIVGSATEKSLAHSHGWVTGVKSVTNEDLEVQGWAKSENLRKDKYAERSDKEIAAAVKDAFLYDPRVFSFNPTVSVKNGVVTLDGTVNNLKAKFAAAENARNVVGVIHVKDNLEVRPTQIPEDIDLAARVSSAMQKDPVVERWEIDVEANRGLVNLNGTVESYFEKSKAEDLASKTKGVVAVNNNITVENEGDRYFSDYHDWNTFYPPYQIDMDRNYKTDQAIEEDIIEEFIWTPYVDEDDVIIVVEGGTAVLNGTVDTRREKIYAEINAFKGGALDVENNLTVNLATDE